MHLVNQTFLHLLAKLSHVTKLSLTWQTTFTPLVKRYHGIGQCAGNSSAPLLSDSVAVS